MRARRRGLSGHERAEAARCIARRLAGTHLFQRSRRIAFYHANDGEVDASRLMERAWEMNKQCFLPKLYRIKTRRLWFAPSPPDVKLADNRFGIPEPSLSARHMVGARELDLILVPLVAFDKRGNRLGMGGGFYDNTLAYLNQRRHWMKPRLVGVAYEFQKVASLRACHWDVPLHAIVTEAQIYAPMGAVL
jgi:5-formyltetrahydrofolate cyclo-ligase